MLLFILGTGGVSTIVEPYRTYIGSAGIALLVLALAVMWRAYRDAHPVPGEGPTPRVSA